MTQNGKMCSSLVYTIILVTCLAVAAVAHAQQGFDQKKAAKAIADSGTFKDCHTGINDWDTCNGKIYTGRWNYIAEYWGSHAAQLQPDALKANPFGYWLYKEKGYLQLSASPEALILSDKGKIASKGWNHVGALPDNRDVSTQSPFDRWEVPLATKRFVGITNVLQGPRMGVHFAEVHYTWVYSLTPLGIEFFKNEKVPSTGRNVGGWITPAELTGIELNKTFEAKATFILHKDGWRLQENCGGDIC